MAQFFYDFKDAAVGTDPPNGLERFSALDSNYYQEFGRVNGGLSHWLKYTDSGSGIGFTNTGLFGPTGIVSANVECLAKLVCLHFNGPGYSNDGPTFFARTDNPAAYSNGYELSLMGTLADTSTTFMRKRVGGVNTTIGGSSGSTNKAVPFWVRFQVNGTDIRLRTWPDGTSEPATWGNSVVDSSVSAAGRFYFGIRGASGTGEGCSAGTRYKIYQLSFGTDGDAAPVSRTRYVYGSVKKPDGTAAVGYLVRCYSRSSGELLDEMLTDSTGAFSFTISYADTVYCMAVDQVGNTWNAPVVDLLTPEP